MKPIIPKKIFRKDILEYSVDTSDLGMVRYVNLDNAATTPPFASVQQKVSAYLNTYGSVHRGAGEKSKISTNLYEESRETLKHFVNAPKDSYVILTSNTTGAMNTAAHFFSFIKGKIAVSSIEHSSSWLPWIKAEGIKLIGSQQSIFKNMDNLNKKIQTLGQNQVIQYDVNEKFEFDLTSIERLFQNNTIKAFVLTASSNATGYCPDIKAIGDIVHRYGAYFIVDGCQFIQHHPIDMQSMGIDFLAASGHKFYAPYGGGFLIGPKNFLDRFLPYEIGGGNLPYITQSGEFLRYKNQLAHDPGTPNAVGMIAMAEALRQLQSIGLQNIESYEKNLTQQVFDALKNNPAIELYVQKQHLSTVILFNIRNKNFRDVAESLNQRFGIGVRAGSFCVYHVMRKLLHINDDSHIIQNVLDGKENAVPGFVRASFALCNTQKDVDRFLEAIAILTKE